MQENIETVEVAGETYTKKQKKRMSPQMQKVFMMSQMMGGGPVRDKVSEELSDIDIVSEYQLILEKKSKLSRRQRDWVEHQFHLNYEKS